MATRGRGISKSLRSVEHAVFRAVMIEIRKKAGLTQQELAKRLRRPQSFVAKYEGGERLLDVAEFVGIVRAIGADPFKLLKAIEKEQS